MSKMSKVVAVVLEIDGNQVTAYPVTPEKLQELKSTHANVADRLEDCNCGDEFCLNGYIYVCAEGPSGRCQLFGSDWQCNG